MQGPEPSSNCDSCHSAWGWLGSALLCAPARLQLTQRWQLLSCVGRYMTAPHIFVSNLLHSKFPQFPVWHLGLLLFNGRSDLRYCCCLLHPQRAAVVLHCTYASQLLAFRLVQSAAYIPSLITAFMTAWLLICLAHAHIMVLLESSGSSHNNQQTGDPEHMVN